MIAISTFVNGILLGGLYALYGLGLSLTFGIMRTVNLAHGDVIVLATYLALLTTQVLGLTPILSLVVLVPVMFCIGYGLQRLILNRALKDGMMPAVIITFGLSFVIQNGLLLGFSADRQVLRQGALETMSVTLAPGLTIGVFPILTLGVLLVMIVALQAFMGRTLLGRAFRATSDDPSTAQLVGIDGKRIYGLAMGLSFALIAVTGVVMGIRSNFSPFDGPARLIFAFEVIIIGGMGSIYGVLAGGMILGLAQTIGGVLNPTFFQLAGHVVTLGILVLRPSGLFPETIERE
ncbi:branched-chain amino acid ABC transporter permease [Celeribacter baekdonensis]|uniref:branched-chain amino acid ABC transporter permease n=1 Tax=Celeribacter baekdonensis TaxID=875171 RepID=UPI003A94E070